MAGEPASIPRAPTCCGDQRRPHRFPRARDAPGELRRFSVRSCAAGTARLTGKHKYRSRILCAAEDLHVCRHRLDCVTWNPMRRVQSKEAPRLRNAGGTEGPTTAQFDAACPCGQAHAALLARMHLEKRGETDRHLQSGVHGREFRLPRTSEAVAYKPRGADAVRGVDPPRARRVLVRGGALAAETGMHTGRSPKDKYIVRDATTENAVWWDNNKPITPEQFEALLADFLAHAKGKDAVRSGPLRRRRSGATACKRARLHRIRLALAVHPQPAAPAASATSSPASCRIHDRRPAHLQGRSEAPRRAQSRRSSPATSPARSC